MYDFNDLKEKERIYQYWNHNQSGEPICSAIKKYFDGIPFKFCEIGCQLGGMSDLILHEFSYSTVFSVDIENQNQYILSEFLPNKFKGRFAFLQESSLTAENRFEDSDLDFIYIDTDPHKEDQLNLEISLWIPKVKSTGIVCFHDYEHPSHPDVKKCIDKYCKENNYHLYILDYYNVYFQKR